MTRRTPRSLSVRSFALALGVASLLVALQLPTRATARQTDLASISPQSPAYFPLGIVTGGIYNSSSDPVQPQQSIAASGSQIFSEYSRLGAQWIRVEVGWTGTSAADYNRIVDLAHAQQPPISVLAVVQVGQPYTGDLSRGSIVAYCQQYEARLESLSTWFDSVRRPDAWEITNEPNTGGPINGSDPRIPGSVYPYLIKYVWKHFHPQHQWERIVTGGELDTFSSDGWWTPMLSSPAWSLPSNDPDFGTTGRPFDLWGIHPYNWIKLFDTNTQDKTHQNILDANPCSNYQNAWSQQNGGGDSWDRSVLDGLQAIYSRVSGLVGDWNWQFFVTEYGFPLKAPGATWGLTSELQMAYGLQHACSVLSQAAGGGRVAGLLYFSYRDFWTAGGSSNLGLRQMYSDQQGLYPARQILWERFHYLATGSGATPCPNQAWLDADCCWPTFADVLSSSRVYSAVQALAQRNVISGYTCGSLACDQTTIAEACDVSNRPYFRPDATVTRGQFCKIVCIAFGFPIVNPQNGTFEDVPPGSTFYTYVETCAARGIISGYACGAAPAGPCDPWNRPYFLPGNTVTRQQVVKILCISANISPSYPSTGSFADVPESQNAYPYGYVEALRAQGALNSYPCGQYNPPLWAPEGCDWLHRPYFHPALPALRGDVCYMVARVRGWI